MRDASGREMRERREDGHDAGDIGVVHMWGM
jgi:hypothetical protein